jgi:hypothetical protein
MTTPPLISEARRLTGRRDNDFPDRPRHRQVHGSQVANHVFYLYHSLVTAQPLAAKLSPEGPGSEQKQIRNLIRT